MEKTIKRGDIYYAEP